MTAPDEDADLRERLRFFGIEGGLHPIAPVSLQAGVTLSPWYALRLPSGAIHLIGYCSENAEGRVSSRVVAGDASTQRCWTASGRQYTLRGPHGVDPDALWVWQQRKAVQQIVDEVDVSDQLFDLLSPSKSPHVTTFGPVLYCGDPHGGVRGSLDYIVDAAMDTEASAVILLGDIEPAQPLHLALEPILDRVWWIPGNHDSDSDEMWSRVATPAMSARNLHGHVIALPDGTRIAGLGGVFRESVWHPTAGAARGGEPAFKTRREHGKATPRQERWEGGHHRKHWGTIYPDELDRLADLRADVLVTHEAPAYHPNGFDILDTLAQALGVRVSVHGHHHDNLEASGRWVEQGFKSFGVGLRGITAIDLDGVQSIVRAGDLDHDRAQRGSRK